MIVLDASAAVELLLGQPRGAPGLRARLSRSGETVHVPHVFDLEVISAIRRHALGGFLSAQRARRAVAALEDLRAERYSHVPFRPRIWELRAKLTPHEAAYVALAEALPAPLLTMDAALAQAPGVGATVELHG